MYHHRAAEMPDKRTRGEMEALRAEMADLQQRFKQRDAKANLAAQRYKDKIQVRKATQSVFINPPSLFPVHGVRFVFVLHPLYWRCA
eukprot:m.336991 g.336991  ORF g.336991 m.336991 type:complete len:87 (-) comp19799_c1_seq14:863-1123(-)